MCVYISAFSIGYGPIPWTAVGELFPVNVRSFAAMACMGTNWTLAFIVPFTFESMIEGLHTYGTFWFYGAVCATSVVTVQIVLPETKGKSLNEISQIFRK